MFYTQGSNPLAFAPQQERYERFNKSLTVGTGPQGPAPGVAGPLIQEALDGLLVNVCQQESDMLLFPNLFKQPTRNPVYQYDLITSWGRKRSTSRYKREISRPRGDNPNYVRMKDSIAYMGILGQISFAALNTNMIEDPETLELRSQTMALMRDIETELYVGDSSLNPLGFDGYRSKILKYAPATNVVDCKGQGLTLNQVDKLLTAIRKPPNFGLPNTIHLDFGAHADFNRSYVPQFRDPVNAPGTREFNLEFQRFRSVVGNVEIQPTTFIDAGSNGAIDPGADPLLVPAAPTVGTAGSTAGLPSQHSRFYDTDAGGYYWFVQAENQDGVSQMVPVNSSAINVNAGDVVTIPITAAQGPRTDFFTVFRTKKNRAPVVQQGVITQTNAYEVGRVANSVGLSGPQQVTFLDVNFKRPGTTEGYVFDMRQETMFWIQLMALGRTDLGFIQSAKEFMLEIYGAPALRVPGRCGLFINIADSTIPD